MLAARFSSARKRIRRDWLTTGEKALPHFRQRRPGANLSQNLGRLLVSLAKISLDLFAVPEVVGDRAIDVGQWNGRKLLSDFLRGGSLLKRADQALQRDTSP